MNDLDQLQLLERITDIACRASEAIMAVYRREFDVEKKDDRSPLTEADLAAHRIIVDALRELTPDVPVLSEESSEISAEERLTWRRYWLVDPLDGTREFIKRNGEFTVNIALIENHVPTMAVVAVPVDGRCFRAVCGRAELVDAQGVVTELRCAAPASPLRAAGSRSHGSSETADHLARLGDVEMVPRGSSLKFCEVASGQADLYLRLGPTCEWDTAAAHCVLKAAGGEVLNMAGEPLRYNTDANLKNPEFLAVGDPARDWVGEMGLAARGTARQQ
jgi:3'(2'), 5'-bisphosphate nucleotidase